MAIKEVPVKSHQDYSIIRIVETGSRGETIIETFALTHAAAGVIAEFAALSDAVRELNRMLSPLPGLNIETLKQAV
ncbi:hypothetical protein [Hydrocarboniclastica marina]|uniref:Uncharacterized protein n=1 Tax=Hydrocarboniclastica marina TaxID=2259620 RepID=A0A4P7XIH2_9ALTE|nr:hypothetical protein [Hydrocarboniclastica marina]MAL99133.1 hypothetical protein [Alteromonadaceae bacterium]QCF26818.1 hypothetical protein soil367_13235 [Hydrocarboniclastica marina]|tara:strand:+ start:3519 stop:3746 length:228 start_codon:yes stop_codon:yes gene_type:complete